MNGKNSFERLERLPAKLLHGGDYNPEQWLDRPDILKQDIDYMKAAHINVVTLGYSHGRSMNRKRENIISSGWMPLWIGCMRTVSM